MSALDAAGSSDLIDFLERWKASGASERANAALFLSELCDVLGVPRPSPSTADVRRNAYVFERAVTLDDGEGQTSTNFIDLYKRGAFILEAKQGSDRPAFEDDLAGDRHRLKAGTARRETRTWERAMKKAKEQALRYARALPAGDGWPPFLVVVDVGYCIDLLIKAAEAEWKDVEPAIFGTLLERALDPTERHKLGAHFTPRAYVERLVLPTIVEPLREEWNAVQAAAAAREAGGDEAGARGEIETFHRRLCSLRVLDPACGSGNFLYVTLEHLKRLEGEVMQALATYAGQQTLDMTGGFTVTPAQLLGLELNPRAAAIADVVLWIGYLQWHFRAYGHARRLDPPILRNYRNIACRDAVLERGDAPRQAPWPKADFIVGNPPFIGPAMMREALGDDYTEALRRAYRGEVPESADVVMYWWHRAAGLVRAGEAERFGFITTNSLRQTFNRRVVAQHLEAKEPLSLAYAIPDHPWVDSAEGADVRISMTVGVAGDASGRLARVAREVKAGDERDVVLQERQGKIQADLTIGANVAGAGALKANENLSNRGFELGGSGFIVTPDHARALGLGVVDGLERHIRAYRNGRDLTATPRGVMVIDLYGLEADDVRRRYPEVYQHVYETVRPERQNNRSATLRERWWLHRRLREDLRQSLDGLSRYIATVETSKHRFFQFLDASILPDNMLVVVASDDAYHLGVLSSRVHVAWALAAGGRLGVGNDPRYNKTRCFETFPFPAAGAAQQATIRALADELDAFRKARLAAHPKLTMTDLYNVLEKLRAGDALEAKEDHIHRDGLVSVLRDLHDRLDAAVADAYGWPADLPDDEILERLVALNHERAEEERQGLVRYLRPAFQNPQGAQQAALDVKVAPKAAKKASTKLSWPKSLPERVQAVQRILATEHGPFTAAELGARFSRARADQVAPLLTTLEVLGLVRETEAGAFVA